MNRSNLQRLICALSIVLFAAPVVAQDGRAKAMRREQFNKESGAIEGAIWQFELKPKKGNPAIVSSLKGRFRVADLKIYQADAPGEELNREIGTSKPLIEEKITVAEFEKLRAFKGPQQVYDPLKGRARLNFVEFGHLEGEFIDSSGYKWEMIMRRVRE